MSMRDGSKNLFKVLNYDLKPFFSSLSLEERGYLRELLEEVGSEGFEVVLWEIADTFSRKFSGKNELSIKQIEDVKRFGKNWFLRNWRWALNDIGQRLKEGTEQKTDIVADAPVELVDHVLEAEVIETIRMGEEIKAGNLAGWTLMYSENMSLNQRNLISIGGESLDERKEQLDKFLRDEGISCTIGAGSVINAFDWVVMVPDEVENIRMRKKIGRTGEVFRKLKRGPVRIFYQMDRATKQIVFFVHQKQAWNYGF